LLCGWFEELLNFALQQVAEKVKLFTPASSAVPTGDLLGWDVRFSLNSETFCIALENVAVHCRLVLWMLMLKTFNVHHENIQLYSETGTFCHCKND